MGESILIPITLRNAGAQNVELPDLSKRAWLVRFEFEPKEGQRRVHRNTPPEHDGGWTVTLKPKGKKTTLLEVPSGAAFKKGEYQFSIVVKGVGEEERKIGPKKIRLMPARPVAGDLGGTISKASSGSLSTIWVHDADEGFDMYLHQTEPRQPRKTRGDYFLMHFDTRIAPRLSMPLGMDAKQRWVHWRVGERGIAIMRLQGRHVRGLVRNIELPWPEFELMARGVADASGKLNLAVWVPAPSGSKGEVRLAILDKHGAPDFRRVGRFDAKPDQVVSMGDAAGRVHLLIRTNNEVTMYSLAASEGSDGIPMAGRRIRAGEEGGTVLSAAYGVAPATEAFRGGTAVLLLIQESDGAVRWEWRGLRGDLIVKHGITHWPKQGSVYQLVPRGGEAPGVVFQLPDGSLEYVEGTSQQPLAVANDVEWSLARGADGTLYLRKLNDRGPVQVKPLVVAGNP